MNDQGFLFNEEELEKDWEKDWVGMPEYKHKSLEPFKQIIVSFKCEDDIRAFAKLIDQRLTVQTQSVWYPEVKHENVIGVKRYADEEDLQIEKVCGEADEINDSDLKAAGEFYDKLHVNTAEEDPQVEKLDEQMVDLHINTAGELPEMPELITCDMCDVSLLPGEALEADFNAKLCPSCYGLQAGGE